MGTCRVSLGHQGNQVLADAPKLSLTPNSQPIATTSSVIGFVSKHFPISFRFSGRSSTLIEPLLSVCRPVSRTRNTCKHSTDVNEWHPQRTFREMNKSELYCRMALCQDRAFKTPPKFPERCALQNYCLGYALESLWVERIFVQITCKPN